jgi:hypothetical protein
LPQAKTPLAPPQPETIEYLRHSLIEDVLSLGELLSINRPMWPDFEDYESRLTTS